MRIFILFFALALSLTGSILAKEKQAMTNKYETTVLAGGCFWGVEELFKELPGVVETNVGYTGGSADTANYHDVSSGETGHAEAVQIVFDPSKISFEKILLYFFRLHDPTTLNKQENDVGSQYRSAIFYTNEKQKEVALQVKKDISTKWKDPVVTEIVPLKEFYPAEEYHQDYLDKNPNGYRCHYLRKE